MGQLKHRVVKEVTLGDKDKVRESIRLQSTEANWRIRVRTPTEYQYNKGQKN